MNYIPKYRDVIAFDHFHNEIYLSDLVWELNGRLFLDEYLNNEEREILAVAGAKNYHIQ